MSITISLTKAKIITKERLRLERGPLMKEHDVLFMQAQEAGESTTNIVKEKKRLREITDGVDSCENITQLSALKASK